jgi:peptide/nickel transport system substrate-binding protein
MSWGYLPEVGQLLQAQYKAVGVDLQTQLMAFPAAVAAAGQGSHNLAPMTFFDSDPSILGTTYLSSNVDGGFNWSRVRDAELDRLLNEGVSQLDSKARSSLYGQAQTRILDLALVLPIRDYVNLIASKGTVRGLRFDFGGWFPWLHDVYLGE